MRYLLVVGAYRDNEVGSNHPLARTVELIGSEGVPVVQLAVLPLSEATLVVMLSEMLQGDPVAAAALSL